jgi:Tfp pilus assembly protein PilF
MTGISMPFRWPVIAAALLACAAMGEAQAPEPDRGPAQALFDAGRFDEAAVSFGKLAAEYAAQYPRSEKQRYYCGEGGAEALLYLATAAADNVSASVVGTAWCEALFMQAYSYVEAKQLKLAVAPLEVALELAPHNAKYWNELGFVRSRLGQLEEGLTVYERALEASELNPEDPHHKAVALRGIGWIHAERRDWDLAEEVLRRSLEIEPDSTMALGELDYIAQERARD